MDSQCLRNAFHHFSSSGLILEVERVFHPLETHKAFNDVLYWNLPDEAEINDYDKKDGEDAEHHQPMITYTDSSGPQVEKTSSYKKLLI